MNRARPQLHCNGKCYLARRLRAAEAAERKQLPGSTKQAFQEIILFCAAAEPLRFVAPPTAPAAAPPYAALRVGACTRALPVLDHPPTRG